MEKNFICVTYAAIWDQVVHIQPIWDQNARKEAGDKLSVSFNICELSAPLVSVKVSCYYPDFNLPCPPALVHLGLTSICPIPGLQQGKQAAAAIDKIGDTDARRSSGKPPCPRRQDWALVNSWGDRTVRAGGLPSTLSPLRKPRRRSGARQRGRAAVPGPRLGREAGSGIRAARRGWPRRACGGRARPERGWSLADD